MEQDKTNIKEYRCNNCKDKTINSYRYNHCDKLCKDCWEIIYGCGDSNTTIENSLLGYRKSCNLSYEDQDEW